MTDRTVSQGTERAPEAREPTQGTRDVPVFSPPVDIYETAEALILLAEMPGVEAGGVTVSLENRELTITGKSMEARPGGVSLVHAEYREGDYERKFTVSELVDRDRIEAAMTNGVLRLTLPKAAPATARKIQVKAG